ncbi:GNAT family N-acetyltransferase [Pseudosporangium ferrugineum]|uniref:Acetyltransferase (GNAT) family protein n=1 Tax=Pseudosporangium ferrugineum TaxID=439699 RepID=A0A2T0RS48_9ACTN|nr:GNAT family N-acetyltransferase [Pseudosporangium ferrugineum]PRY23981.1 acetyltransferase (GNAT) family protein [Pseudosporangium ferrugineum]
MTQPHTTSAAIRSATYDDAPAMAELLVEAFLHGDLGPWLIPHLHTRARVYRPYFALLTEQALDHGHVQISGDASTDLVAVAIWYPIAGGPPPVAADYDTRLADITGQYQHRFVALDDVMHRHHPYDAWHHYLAFLAVHPDRQHHGLGSTLLAHHHAELDATGTPSYLEATGSRNARLYARHGYRPRASYRIGGDGPALHPMWRPPAT